MFDHRVRDKGYYNYPFSGNEILIYQYTGAVCISLWRLRSKARAPHARRHTHTVCYFHGGYPAEVVALFTTVSSISGSRVGIGLVGLALWLVSGIALNK